MPPPLPKQSQPGIREFPALAKERSYAIARRYLSDPETLVLAVCPATTTRLTASQVS
jgi:hypothetical protein